MLRTFPNPGPGGQESGHVWIQTSEYVYITLYIFNPLCIQYQEFVTVTVDRKKISLFSLVSRLYPNTSILDKMFRK